MNLGDDLFYWTGYYKVIENGLEEAGRIIESNFKSAGFNGSAF